MTKARLAIPLLPAWLIWAPLGWADGESTGFNVVVNAANPVTALSRDEIARLFLKKTNTWPNGSPVVPVDQRSDSIGRQAFCRDVLRKDLSEISSYWNQMIVSGRAAPPLAKGSDDDVLAYVRANPNAIGYVADRTPLGQGIKILAILK